MSEVFQLDAKQVKALSVWLKEHNKTCRFAKRINQGCIGGRLEYKFTPTSLGLCTIVLCACGTYTNLTDYESW